LHILKKVIVDYQLFTISRVGSTPTTSTILYASESEAFADLAFQQFVTR